MESFAVNEVGKVRHETLNGREHLVVPMTLIVPGILAGSRGPLLYPPREVERSAPSWNNVPIVVYHPTDNDGNHVSAKHPGVLGKSGIGVVRQSTYNGKHVAEGWFDVSKTKQYDRQLHANGVTPILPRLIAGQPIELSTGLFTDNDERPGQWRGREYIAVARNYRPDHLAVLPDQVGACSINDGCGVNNADEARAIILASSADETKPNCPT